MADNATKGFKMSQVLACTEQTENRDPEHQKGQTYFGTIISYLAENNIEFEHAATGNDYIKGCVAVTNIDGNKIFIRFDFYTVGSWRGSEYKLGVYKDETAVAMMGDDKKSVLMNTQRGVNGFEKRFEGCMAKFTGRNLSALRLA